MGYQMLNKPQLQEPWRKKNMWRHILPDSWLCGPFSRQLFDLSNYLFLNKPSREEFFPLMILNWSWVLEWWSWWKQKLEWVQVCTWVGKSPHPLPSVERLIVHVLPDPLQIDLSQQSIKHTCLDQGKPSRVGSVLLGWEHGCDIDVEIWGDLPQVIIPFSDSSSRNQKAHPWGNWHH